MWPVALALAGQFLGHRGPEVSASTGAPELLPFAADRASTEAELQRLLDAAKERLAECGACDEQARLGASVQRYEHAQEALRRIVNSTAPQELHKAEAQVEQLRANVVDLRSLEAVAVARRKFLEEQQRDLAQAENVTLQDLHSVDNVLKSAEEELQAAELNKQQKYKVAETWATQVQSTVIAAELSDEIAEKMYAGALSKEHAADAKLLRAKELFAKAEALADRVDQSIARKKITTPRVADGLGGWGSGDDSIGETTTSTTTVTLPPDPAGSPANTTAGNATEAPSSQAEAEDVPEAGGSSAGASVPAAEATVVAEAVGSAGPAELEEPDMAAIDAELSAVR